MSHRFRRIGSRTALLVTATALLLAAPAAAEPVVVYNDAPAMPRVTYTLQEKWSVGGDDEDFLIGMMVDSLDDADGNVYLLDSQLNQVEVFSPDGEHLNTLSREGDGPGEVRAPQDLVLFPDGTLGIVKLFPGEIVRLAPNGDPLGTLTFGGVDGQQTGFVVAFNADCRGGTFVVAAQRSTIIENGQDRTQFLASLTEDGAEKARFRESTMILDFNTPRFVEKEVMPSFLLTNTVGPDGRVYVPRDRDSYAVEVYAPDGTLERVIERSYENRVRDARDLARLNALVDAWTRAFPGEMERDLDRCDPPITELFVDDDGTLWVQHSRSGHDQPEGVLLTFDTFDAQGKYLREVSIAAPGDPYYDGIRLLGGGRALLIKGYVLARWASRDAQGATFGEDGEAEPMAVVYGVLAE